MMESSSADSRGQQLISFTSLAYNVIAWTAAVTATPSPEPSVYPEYNGDPNLVTPGVVGFAATLFIAVATTLIVLDMNRRVRRVRYRELAQETIRNEQAGVSPASGVATGADTATEAGDVTGGATGAATDPDADPDHEGPPTQRAD
jgi:hypothetical protein